MTRGESLTLAAVAHDLRTPLGAITMKARYLLDAILPADDAHRRAREEVDGIVRSARMMERLVHDLLDASRIGASAFRIATAVHHTGAIVADATDALAGLATQKGIAIASVIDARAITCDRDRVLQALANLVGNAIKFTPAGGAIEIRGLDGGDHFTFSVIDSGPGIPAELAARVFEPFVHGDSRGAGAAGLGLGLYIASAIADAHGGRLWIDHTGPTGTTMCFQLPA